MNKKPLLNNIDHLISAESYELLLRADAFLNDFEQNGIPEGYRRLLETLDKAQFLLDALNAAAKTSAFLGGMDMDQGAENDNDILENAANLENDLSFFNNMAGDVHHIQQRLIKVLSRSTFL